jgi:hypothetical protein
MALWDFICDDCGKRRNDINVPVDSSADMVCDCGSVMRKDYSTIKTVVVGDIPEHFNESLGCWVSSRRDLRTKLWENNARTETIDPEGGLTPQERAEMRGEPAPPEKKSIFERRKEPFWDSNPSSPEDGLYVD